MALRKDDSERLEAFAQLCRAHGLAVTVQRREVYAAIMRRTDHPTADQIYAAVRRRLPDVSRTTVYRVLETLVQMGAITKACHPGAAARYDPLTQRHHHLVCMHCERVLDVADARLDELPLPRIPDDFAIEDYSVHFRGVCGACRKRTRPAAPAPTARPKKRVNQTSAPTSGAKVVRRKPR